MPTALNLNEAKTKFSGVIDYVESKGASITILRYGKAVARIVPVLKSRNLEPDPRLTGVSIRDEDLFDDCSGLFEVMSNA